MEGHEAIQHTAVCTVSIYVPTGDAATPKKRDAVRTQLHTPLLTQGHVGEAGHA